jgi:hypothetical protein
MFCQTRQVKRLAITLVSVVVVASVVSLAIPTSRAAGPERIGGVDRYSTATLVSERVLASGSPHTAILVTGANFPDALVAGTWPRESVVLLTRPQSLPWETFTTLLRSEITDVVIVGGSAVVSTEIERVVTAIGKPTRRVFGADRYLTSAAVVTESESVSSLWLAPGDSFVDQLNAVAFAQRNSGAVALVPPGSGRSREAIQRYLPSLIPSATIHVVDHRRRVEDVSIAGHVVTVHDDAPFVLSASLVDKTSVAAVLVSGDNWPDALSASRLTSADRPLVITRQECLPQPVTTAVAARSLTIVGGPMAVSDAVSRGVVCAIGEVPTAAAISTCQVPDARVQRNQPYSVGFPLAPGADGTPSSGRFPIVVFPVDFADVPGQPSDIARMNRAVAFADEWLRTESNGTLSADWRVSETWIHLPSPSIDYDTPKGESGYIDKAVSVAREIITLADPTTNFAGNPFVFFVFPQTLTDIDTDVGYFNAQISTSEGRVAKFFGGGLFFNLPDPYEPSQPRDLWSFWIHEIGHTWGLAGHAPASVLGSDALGADLHLMDNQNGLAYVLSAWDQFLLGWMNEREIHCLALDQVGSFETTLAPLESSDLGTKTLMIRLSPTRVMVVEAHRPIGFGARLAPHPGGVVAYVVDTAVENDRTGEGTGEARTRYAQYLGPVNPPGSPRSRGQVDPLIVAGGSATYGDLVLSVVAAEASGDTIRLERIP